MFVCVRVLHLLICLRDSSVVGFDVSEIHCFRCVFFDSETVCKMSFF